MAIGLQTKRAGTLVEIQASGKLTMKDYEELIPVIELLIKEHGKIDLLFEMTDFHGWEPSALWEDAKLTFKHFLDFRRVAIVGEKKWEEWITLISRPFMNAEVRYFDHSAALEARMWIEGPES